MRTDLIADMLTLIRNASSAKKERADVPASKINQEILRILKEYGFIENYRKMEAAGKTYGSLRVYLKYQEGAPVLGNIRRVSKPGLRVYAGKKRIPRVLGGFGKAIVSTSKGLMTDNEARESGVGGEILCYVW